MLICGGKSSSNGPVNIFKHFDYFTIPSSKLLSHKFRSFCASIDILLVFTVYVLYYLFFSFIQIHIVFTNFHLYFVTRSSNYNFEKKLGDTVYEILIIHIPKTNATFITNQNYITKTYS